MSFTQKHVRLLFLHYLKPWLDSEQYTNLGLDVRSLCFTGQLAFVPSTLIIKVVVGDAVAKYPNITLEDWCAAVAWFARASVLRGFATQHEQCRNTFKAQDVGGTTIAKLAHEARMFLEKKMPWQKKQHQGPTQSPTGLLFEFDEDTATPRRVMQAMAAMWHAAYMLLLRLSRPVAVAVPIVAVEGRVTRSTAAATAASASSSMAEPASMQTPLAAKNRSRSRAGAAGACAPAGPAAAPKHASSAAAATPTPSLLRALMAKAGSPGARRTGCMLEEEVVVVPTSSSGAGAWDAGVHILGATAVGRALTSSALLAQTPKSRSSPPGGAGYMSAAVASQEVEELVALTSNGRTGSLIAGTAISSCTAAAQSSTLNARCPSLSASAGMLGAEGCVEEEEVEVPTSSSRAVMLSAGFKTEAGPGRAASVSCQPKSEPEGPLPSSDDIYPGGGDLPPLGGLTSDYDSGERDTGRARMRPTVPVRLRERSPIDRVSSYAPFDSSSPTAAAAAAASDPAVTGLPGYDYDMAAGVRASRRSGSCSRGSHEWESGGRFAAAPGVATVSLSSSSHRSSRRNKGARLHAAGRAYHAASAGSSSAHTNTDSDLEEWGSFPPSCAAASSTGAARTPMPTAGQAAMAATVEPTGCAGSMDSRSNMSADCHTGSGFGSVIEWDPNSGISRRRSSSQGSRHEESATCGRRSSNQCLQGGSDLTLGRRTSSGSEQGTQGSSHLSYGGGTTPGSAQGYQGGSGLSYGGNATPGSAQGHQGGSRLSYGGRATPGSAWHDQGGSQLSYDGRATPGSAQGHQRGSRLSYDGSATPLSAQGYHGGSRLSYDGRATPGSAQGHQRGSRLSYDGSATPLSAQGYHGGSRLSYDGSATPVSTQGFQGYPSSSSHSHGGGATPGSHQVVRQTPAAGAGATPAMRAAPPAKAAAGAPTGAASGTVASGASVKKLICRIRLTQAQLAAGRRRQQRSCGPSSSPPPAAGSEPDNHAEGSAAAAAGEGGGESHGKNHKGTGTASDPVIFTFNGYRPPLIRWRLPLGQRIVVRRYSPVRIVGMPAA